MPALVANLFGVLVCLAPLAAPWAFVGTSTAPLTIWLVAIAGGIVMLKAVDWLARPRHVDQRVRVWLVLTFWPALQIEDVLLAKYLSLRGFVRSRSGYSREPPDCSSVWR